MMSFPHHSQAYRVIQFEFVEREKNVSFEMVWFSEWDSCSQHDIARLVPRPADHPINFPGISNIF